MSPLPNLTRKLAAVFLPLLFAVPLRAALPTAGMKKDASRFGVSSAAGVAVWKQPSAATLQAFADFRAKTSASWEVSFSRRTGAPEVLKNGSNLRYSGLPENAARRFLSDNGSFLQVDQANLKTGIQRSAFGINHLSFDQQVNGLPVFGGTVKVHIKEDGEIVYYQSSYAPDAAGVSATPSLSKEYAASAAAADCSGRASGEAELVYYPTQSDGTVHLAWKQKAVSSDGSWIYLVDAVTGKVLLRYSSLVTATYGTINGEVYETYPKEINWSDYVVKPMRNQYVWVQTADRFTTTDANGYYSYSGYDGRIFTSLRGPYFTVNNFVDKSAHYDNGGGTWAAVTTAAGSAHPYLSNRIYSSTVTLSTGLGAVKVMPHFTADFKVGEMTEYGGFLYADQMAISHPNGRNLAGYSTWRSAGWYGAAVEGSSYTVTLNTYANGPDSFYGYQIDYTSYMYLNNTGYVNATSSFIWNTSLIPSGRRDETNIFYHLNEMRQFYVGGVNGATNPSLNMNFHLPAMAHAHGAPDNSTVGMLNAFYDEQHDNMMFGDGLWDGLKNGYQSFGLDAGIIRHEYTHAVQAHLYPMLYYGESGAIMETYADYWALSSLRGSDADFTPLTSNFAEFFTNSFGEGVVRHLYASDCASASPSVCKKMGGWVSEVHDDSVILSQALWSLRHKTSSNYLGVDTYPASYAANTSMPIADFLVWNAMFFFPDTFIQLKDAMEYVARAYYSGSTETTILSKIETAFGAHDIISPTGGDIYEPNNGASVATNISGSSVTVSATIYPAYDEDYYSVMMPAGKVKITVTRPSAGDGIYNVQLPMILNLYGEYIGQITNPDIANPTINNTCPNTGACYSTRESETLEVDISSAGRYFVAVVAGPNSNYNNCADASTSPYKLKLEFSAAGSAEAEKFKAEYDNDEIKFSVPYNTYYYANAPVWAPSTMTATVENFSHAQLRDSNFTALAGTLAYPGTPGTYMAISSVPVKDASAKAFVGRVKLLPGFAARYPAAGTIYLELFGTVRTPTSTGTIVSLGLTQALNLTAEGNGVTVWNNIFNPAKAEKAYIAYKASTAGTLKLRIYTLDGMLVKDLYDGPITEGKGNLEWDGRNADGKIVASGLYFLYVSAPGYNTTKKIVVIH